MSDQEKKQFLMRYRDCEREINRLEEEIERWRSRAERMTAHYSHTPVMGNSEDRVQSAVCEIDGLKRELCSRLRDAAAVRREIERAIRSVGEERLRMLLEYRYIDEMTLERIAEQMHYSWRQVANLHNRAIGEVCIKQQPREAQ